jgi:hypothetical protein
LGDVLGAPVNFNDTDGNFSALFGEEISGNGLVKLFIPSNGFSLGWYSLKQSPAL